MLLSATPMQRSSRAAAPAAAWRVLVVPVLSVVPVEVHGSLWRLEPLHNRCDTRREGLRAGSQLCMGMDPCSPASHDDELSLTQRGVPFCDRRAILELARVHK